MKVRFRLFASLAERSGAAEGVVELAGDATAGALWEELVRRYPALGETGFRPMVACDMEYADWDTSLQGVGEVGFLPPVSGG